MVTSVDARLQLEGVTSQRAAAKRLGISRNTVKKYWEDNAVPWDRKEYNRESAVMTPEMVQFTSSCLDEDDRERVKKQRHTARRIYRISWTRFRTEDSLPLKPYSSTRRAGSQEGNSGLRSFEIRSG